MALAQLSEMELVCLSLSEDGVMYVVDHLIWGNPGVNTNLPHPYPDFSLMNDTQRAVGALAQFDADTMNGGVSQFIFNYPELVGMFLDALPSMAWPDFERRVRTLFEGLTDEMVVKLRDARDAWDRGEEFEDRWASFRAWMDAFDDNAFNTWFFENTDEFARRLMQLVWRRRSELITGAPGLA